MVVLVVVLLVELPAPRVVPLPVEPEAMPVPEPVEPEAVEEVSAPGVGVVVAVLGLVGTGTTVVVDDVVLSVEADSFLPQAVRDRAAIRTRAALRARGVEIIRTP
ncbi:hypothetical protein [Ramlibacter sp.]|uniref:hypothetical protein n=1 Tax=Ramlibacter sp. TaxID=1917967 RepID=UPI0017B04A30|nr:hypothetical protein [Ramlibacter sp.]MBA2672846.1 hypothetical protein [Ramlibacter sp.]